MRFFFATGGIALLHLFAAAVACSDHTAAARGYQAVARQDGDGASPTAGWLVQHFSLNVGDLEESLHFYIDILGLKVYTAFNPAESLRIANIGYPTDGVPFWLELVHLVPNATVPATPPPVGPDVRSGTFSHFGIAVTDMQAARQRFIDNDVTIEKDIGEDLHPFSPLFTAFGLDRLPCTGDRNLPLRQTIIKSLRGAGFRDMLVIQDPDGNLIEIFSIAAPQLAAEPQES